MLKAIGKAIGGFFGGGSTVLYVLLGTLVLGMYANYKLVLKENERLVDTNKTLTAAVAGHKNAAVTTGKQHARGKENDKDKDDHNNTLDGVEDTNGCTNSDPIRVTLDWLQSRRGGGTDPDSDKPDVQLQPPARP